VALVLAEVVLALVEVVLVQVVLAQVLLAEVLAWYAVLALGCRRRPVLALGCRHRCRKRKRRYMKIVPREQAPKGRVAWIEVAGGTRRTVESNSPRLLEIGKKNFTAAGGGGGGAPIVPRGARGPGEGPQ
jgi:hypothetical protein